MIFMVLSSWLSHCESSPGSFDDCRLSAGWPPTLIEANWLELWVRRKTASIHIQHPRENIKQEQTNDLNLQQAQFFIGCLFIGRDLRQRPLVFLLCTSQQPITFLLPTLVQFFLQLTQLQKTPSTLQSSASSTTQIRIQTAGEAFGWHRSVFLSC